MLSALLALLASLSYGTTDTLARISLRHTSAYTLALVVVTGQSALVGAGLLFVERQVFSWQGAAWYVLGGVANPALLLPSFFAGIQRMGVARASTVKATAPLFGVLTAVLLLGERPTVAQYVGAVAISAGVMTLHAEAAGGAWPWRAIGFPLLAAFFSGMSSNLFKLGLSKMEAPVLGLFLASVAATVVLVAARPWFPRDHREGLPSRVRGLLLLQAVLASTGNLLLLYALQVGNVSLVVPLVQTSPFFVLLYSGLFLQTLERLTVPLLAGSALILLGAFLVTAYRPF